MNRSTLLLSNFAMHLFLLTPAVLIAAAVGGHFMSRKGLAPVAAIATEARRINDRNLGVRLPVSSTRDELANLSETLHQILERIDSGVKSIREFTANAAHELRTPLALIRTEVEVALSFPRSGTEYREVCEQVQLETVRLGGLIDSLLMLARRFGNRGVAHSSDRSEYPAAANDNQMEDCNAARPAGFHR